MQRIEIVRRAASLLRDESNTIYTKSFLNEMINEGIDRFRQLINELKNMPYILNDTDIPQLLPSEYHHLLAIYSMARCYETDERHYEANKYMNEFEVKVADLNNAIAEGKVVITDPNTGLPVVVDIPLDFVKNMYFKGNEDIDAETTEVQM